jgi:hypothetical protein
MLYAALAVVPDLDLLVGAHSSYTHSVGAVALVGLAALMWVARSVPSRSRPASVIVLALAAASAYGSHLALDWLGNDDSPPIGIMALWPFDGGYYQSDLHWFQAIDRRYWGPGFWIHNLSAITWEVIWLGPLAAVAWLSNRTGDRSSSGRPSGAGRGRAEALPPARASDPGPGHRA